MPVDPRHPREGGDSGATQAVDLSLLWIPAFAGMTEGLQRRFNGKRCLGF